MGRTLREIMAALPEDERKEIEAETQELLSLQEFREAVELTQADMAKLAGLTQSAVSQLEKKGDMRLSTLRKYVRAAGGDLDLVVSLPNGVSFKLTGFAGEENGKRQSA